MKFLLGLFRHRTLIFDMTYRQVIGRYHGSILGLVWSFVTPMLMLAVYTFIFSEVFKARWSVDSGNKAMFAMVLFSGLIIYQLFADVVGRSSALILGNKNFVKKVVFPLEIFSVVAVLAGLFQFFVNVLVLILFVAIFGEMHVTMLLFPVVIFPYLFMLLGFSWFLASLGVYLRDIKHVVSVLISALIFLSPIFYPLSSLPEKFQFYISLNPLTFIIEQSRSVLIFGSIPDLMGLGLYLVAGIGFSISGAFWFQKTRKGFADVV